jgi:predicted TIM-barrel fold metal-dependent hydrolase
MDKVGFIDTDAHVIEPDYVWESYLEPKYRDDAPVLARVGYREGDQGFGFYNDVTIDGLEMPIGSHGILSVMPDLHESYDDYVRAGFPVSSYIDAMDRTGISHMVLYPSAGLYTNQAPTTKAAAGAAYRRAYNNWLHDFCSDGGGRLVGAGALDLRDPEEAAREAIRCVDELGFKAVTINPSPVGPYHLSDPEMDRLWATIADLNVPIGVHVGALNPSDPFIFEYFSDDARLARAVSAFTIGNMIACAAFVVGGVLERHPTLRVVHLESGAGWAAIWLYRLQVGNQGGRKGLPTPGLTMEPIDYWRRQCYVSTEPDDPGIRQVVEAIGDDNIVIATDFGHPEGRHYSRTIEEIQALPGVSDETKRKMMWSNALKLYPIEV